jgi:hypothetical protein
MKIQVVIFWNVAPDIFTLKMEGAKSCETLVAYYIITRCLNPEDHEQSD